MHPGFSDHLEEEALERFLLNQCSETELADVETHTLWCHSCLFRLQKLELEIAALRYALEHEAAHHESTADLVFQH